MRLVHDLIAFVRRLLALAGWRPRDRDLRDEIAFHIDMRRAEYERTGLPPDDADRAARRQFGNAASLKEQTRDMWRFPSFDSLVQDIRYAIRSLIKAPGFSVVAILVLAIGVGANTAMFSLVHAMLLRGLPYPDADRLVVLIGNVQRATVERRGNSLPDHRDWRARATTFVDMAAFDGSTITLIGGDEPERITIESVSPAYFSLLGATPARGRTFHESEDLVPNQDMVAVLSDALWRRRFNSDPAILNRTIQLSGRSFTVIGVMPPGFTGVSDAAQLWLPFATGGGYSATERGSRGFWTLARLKEGATVEDAQAGLSVIAAQLASAYPASNEKRSVEVSPLARETFRQLRPMVLTLMSAVSFVLLIACTNVANLLIGRSEARQREIAVRTALGAGPARLFRQLVTESCVLMFLGAGGGLLLAVGLIKALVAISPVQFPTFVQPGLNLPVLGFTIGVAVVAGLLLGLAPALHSRISRLTDALKESSRGGSGGLRSQRLRAALVVAEVAMAIVLFIGAGLMIRSAQQLAAIDPGFDTERVLTLNVSTPRQAAAPAPTAAPAQPAPPPPFVLSGREILDRVRSVAGVESVALASDLPLSGGSAALFYAAEGDNTAGAQTAPRAYWHRVSPEFFSTLRIPITSGRTFEVTELTPASPAVIVSDNLAQRFWPGAPAIGKRIRLGGPTSTSPWLTIVGTVAETRYRALPANPTADPDIYLPAVDRSPQAVVVKTSGDPAALAAAIRSAVRAGQSGVAIFGETPLSTLAETQTSASRFTTWILGLFASTALLLSVIGIYGVMSYLVAQRTREFGIRLALGATRSEVVRSVLRYGTTLVAMGTAIGIGVTAGLYRLFSSLLFQVTAFDVSSAVAVLSLAVFALLACLGPAIRATRVDPVNALRQ